MGGAASGRHYNDIIMPKNEYGDRLEEPKERRLIGGWGWSGRNEEEKEDGDGCGPIGSAWRLIVYRSSISTSIISCDPCAPLPWPLETENILFRRCERNTLFNCSSRRPLKREWIRERAKNKNVLINVHTAGLLQCRPLETRRDGCKIKSGNKWGESQKKKMKRNRETRTADDQMPSVIRSRTVFFSISFFSRIYK